MGQSTAMKSLIVFALVGIVAALASAGVLMLRHGRDPRSDGAPDRRMARALALRVGIEAS